MEESSGKEWVRGAVIGAGSFGTVSVAISKSDGNLFAVKSTHNSDSNSIQCLQNEHDILQSLDCPYIVRCLGHDFTRENGLPVFNLLMEYMPGGSVADLLNKFHGHFDESIIRSYTRSILHAIHYLHSQAIVHCDIKCSNILVAPRGIKIADFGSAKRTTDGSTSFPLRGTPLWMAPEVLNHLEQGPPSDIWSLGCTVLEMATGKAPWSHISHPLAAMYHIARTHDLPELPPCLSPQGRDFLEKCFRRDPKQRWTAAQLLNHPFLSNDLCSPQNQHVVAAPVSPTSVLDYHGSSQQESDSHSSSFSNTVPILSLPAGTRAGGCDSQKNRAPEQCPRPSPRQRLLQLAADTEIQRPNWFPSPPGQWIVVKSPQGESPMSAGPFSPLLNASFAQNLPEAECEVSSNATDTDVVDTRSPTVQVACLELKASIEQSQCGSLRRTGIPQLGSNLPNLRSVITARVHPARKLCATPSVNLASDESASCILVTQGVDPRSFHDQLVSSSHKVAACSLCHRMCTVTFCHKTNIKLYSRGRATYSICNFSCKIIQTHFTCLHVDYFIHWDLRVYMKSCIIVLPECLDKTLERFLLYHPFYCLFNLKACTCTHPRTHTRLINKRVKYISVDKIKNCFFHSFSFLCLPALFRVAGLRRYKGE